MSDFKVLGKQVKDVYAVERVTGQSIFSSDVQLKGMLHARLLKSPHARANVTSIDISAAKDMQGVDLIMTKDNFPKLFPPFLDFVGQDVACVVAEDVHTAEEAVRCIKVQYEVLPHVVDPYEAKKEGAPQAIPAIPQDYWALPFPPLKADEGTNIVSAAYKHNLFSDPDEKGRFTKRTPDVSDYDGYGDMDEVRKEVDEFVSDGGYVYSKAQAPLMEISGCVADFKNGKLDVYCPSQMSGVLLFNIAKATGLDFKDVNVSTVCTGGGFGGRLGGGVWHPSNDAAYVLVASAASMELERPVRLYYTRTEEFYNLWGRSGMDSKTEIGFKKDGTIVTMDTESWRNVSTAGQFGVGTLMYDATCTGNMLYSHNCKANKFRKHSVATNGPIFVGWQGFGNPEVFFAVESTMDIAAEKLGIDPIELRRKNHMREGDNFLSLTYQWTGANWLGHTGIEKCIDEGLKRVPWNERKTAAEKTGILRHGIGMSLHCQQNGGEGMAGNAIVKLCSDGSAILVCNYQDIGQSGRTSQCQIVAEALGLPFEKVRFVGNDTTYTPYTSPQSCSSGTFIQGNAAYEAAKEARQKLLEYASKILEKPADELETENGMVFVKSDPEKKIPWIYAFSAIMNSGAYDHIIGYSKYKVPNGPKPAEQGATFVELDVDTETGELKNIKVTIVQDCGTAINPRVVEAHYLTAHHGLEAITGGAEQILDMKTGKLLNNSYIDYPVCTLLDNEIVPVVVEGYEPSTAYGWAGIGQSFENGLPSAVSSAIYNAIGVRLKVTPFTPDRVLEALGKI